MIRRPARPISLARAGVVLALAVAGGVVAANAGIAIVIYVPYATVGAILVIRRPENSIGWLLTAIAWSFALGFLPVQATVEELQTLTAHPIVLALVWFKNGWSAPLTFALIAWLTIVFPTGQLPIGRWRLPAMLVLMTMSAITLAAAVWPVLRVQPEGVDDMIAMPNPLGLLPYGQLDAGAADLPAVLFTVIFALLIVSIVSLIARYARSAGIEQLQLRWFVTGLAAVAIAVPVGFLLFAAFGSAIEGFAWLPATIALALPPIAIGIAVTRHRLYEIDRLISRTIGWALVTGVLVSVFVGGVLALQALLAGVTRGQTLAVAASTLVAFALFQPVRRRVQSAVDRRFDRARYDAQRTVEGFTAGLRDEFDLERVGGELGAVVHQTLAPTSVGVWLRPSLRIPGR